ncbi:hypothetical protein ACFPK9_05990 [Rubritalea spongiae]|uniref:Glycosyltransferase family 1 protein n=1 Tax=Rubritalea spongiae TaxID=430797 RepID=A0ABW5E3V1_9BACT
MPLRKVIEHKLRAFRSYILPSHLKAAAKVRSLAKPIPATKPLCIFDFTSINIDNVAGRYLYHLVTEFESLGYAIAYVDHFRFLATMEAKKYKRLLLQRDYSLIPTSSITKYKDAVLITDSQENLKLNLKCSIRVVYDKLRPSSSDNTAFALPFFVHPMVHESHQVENLAKPTSDNREMAIFFAGNAKAPKYDSPDLQQIYSVFSRVKALSIAKAHLTSHKIRTPDSLEQLLPASGQRQTLTIATTETLPIPFQQWIETLAKADFYFACPGVGMPLCHNLIESLAAGTIPILQYPQYLDPPLEHGINCLTFNDEASLQQALDEALSMSQQQVQLLRKNALSYYRSQLAPGLFAKRMLDAKQPELSLYLNAYRIPR